MRFIRGESGQILPWAIIMLLVLLPVAFGVMGASAAYLVKDQAQMAADAAAIAAADESAVWESLTVYWHAYGCVPGQGGGWACSDGRTGITNLPPTYAATLFAVDPQGIPGWAAGAGCQAVGEDPLGTPYSFNTVTVCDHWALRPGGLGVGYGVGFPPTADPRAAAEAFLVRNSVSLRDHGVRVKLTQFRTDATTGEVDLVVQAVEPVNPLGLLQGRQTSITVEAGSRRRVVAPPQSGS
jgi:hypothetical protein